MIMTVMTMATELVIAGNALHTVAINNIDTVVGVAHSIVVVRRHCVVDNKLACCVCVYLDAYSTYAKK